MSKRTIIEAIECAVFCAMVGALFGLFLIATPDQMSGEADMHKQMCADNGVEYDNYFNQWKAEQVNRIK